MSMSEKESPESSGSAFAVRLLPLPFMLGLRRLARGSGRWAESSRHTVTSSPNASPESVMSVMSVMSTKCWSIRGTGFLRRGLVDGGTGRDRDTVRQCSEWLVAGPAAVLARSSDLSDRVGAGRPELAPGTTLVLVEVDAAGLLLSDLLWDVAAMPGDVREVDEVAWFREEVKVGLREEEELAGAVGGRGEFVGTASPLLCGAWVNEGEET
ncbi:hypothetical protein QBC34DRAFT_409273 [Podospora aff. communis PSN243]|uniref:Uncharacterized protein n=1 Tax=Podospora aff. communis PSN243 TaxID=3040156 RepID=A0AAV9GK06_9PEZI|nr:hypothetical protein QBC34DRAFT_409273 [Podospora aff. communis PSN243]